MTTFQLQSVRRIGRALLLVPLLMVGQTCTELTETPHDALTAITSDAEVLAGVTSVYAQLRPSEWVGYITLQDLTTDVSIVPTRGSDWYDNGQWLDLHRQTWGPNSSGTLAFVNGAWNDSFSGIAKANLMISVVEGTAPSATRTTTLAELRTLRAWYYYMLQDMFGGAPPLVKQHKDKPEQEPSSTRAEIFQFIETELKESVADLPGTWPADGYGRVTKGVANAILAGLYLNAGVFSKNSGVSTSSYNSCAGIQVSGGNACQAAIAAADAVINSGVYSLETPWAKNFSHDNHTSRENIFVIVYTSEGSQGLGANWPMRTLHYNQLTTGWGGPWNGFATLAETYQQFEPTDERRGMWLVGQAFSFETNQPVNDRTGDPLIFTPEIPDADKANEAHGVRFNKFPPLKSAPTGSGHPNDFTYFRLSEMYLIKAEAMNEQGDTPGAITQLAIVHNLRNSNPIPAGLNQAQVRDAILRERVLEFAGEGKRRSDMIRHGKFLTWTEASLNGVCGPSGVCSGARDSKLILFPVPQPQLASNPKLTQNPGY